MHHHEFSYSLAPLLNFFPNPLQEWSQVPDKRGSSLFIPLMRFLLYNLVLSSFLILLRYSFKVFSYLFCLFDRVCIQYSQIFLSLPFSKHSNFFLIWSLYSFHHLSFSASHYQHGTFFNAKLYHYIQTVYSHCMY